MANCLCSHERGILVFISRVRPVWGMYRSRARRKGALRFLVGAINQAAKGHRVFPNPEKKLTNDELGISAPWTYISEASRLWLRRGLVSQSRTAVYGVRNGKQLPLRSPRGARVRVAWAPGESCDLFNKKISVQPYEAVA